MIAASRKKEALEEYGRRLDALRAEAERRLLALEAALPAAVADYLGLRVNWASVARAIDRERELQREYEAQMAEHHAWFYAELDALKEELGL